PAGAHARSQRGKRQYRPRLVSLSIVRRHCRSAATLLPRCGNPSPPARRPPVGPSARCDDSASVSSLIPMFLTTCRVQKKAPAGLATRGLLSAPMRHVNKSWLSGTLGVLLLAAPARAARPAAIRERDRVGVETGRASAVLGTKVVEVLTQSLKVAEKGDEQPAG